PLFLKLRFRYRFNVNLSKAKVHIRIDNSFNQRIIWMTSEANGVFDFSKGEIIFKMDNNPLLPGDYILTVFIHDGIEVADWFPSVLTFTVFSDGGVYKQIRMP